MHKNNNEHKTLWFSFVNILFIVLSSAFDVTLVMTVFSSYVKIDYEIEVINVRRMKGRIFKVVVQ